MKKYNLVLLIAVLFSAMGILNAQQVKFAHVNSQEIFAALPESDSISMKVEKATQEVREQLEIMQVEFNKKYDDYLNNEKNYSELIKKTKQTELQEMEQRIQRFQMQAQQDLQTQQAELFKPLRDKVMNAIDEVAKEKGVLYVFDLSAGSVVYQAETTLDLNAAVLKKLGVE
jgi:outer membrane protein